MNRNERIKLAEQTLAIVGQGRYQNNDGEEVEFQSDLEQCLNGTRHYLPEELDVLVKQQHAKSKRSTTDLELRNETTLQGARRLIEDEGFRRVGVLNFASAKNPGGGFLGGSQAQEESLARSSALYVSLQRCPEYYEYHRRMKSCLYTDRMIFSPQCPVIRDDDGELLQRAYLVDVITSPAPNAGAVKKNTPHEFEQIPNVFRSRIDKALALACEYEIEALVLGAWGCGVFRNDPTMVASLFAEYINPDAPYYGRFHKILFSVLDHTEGTMIYDAFEKNLCTARQK